MLDVGCGDGALLQLLSDTKDVDGRGIEVSRERVNACVARGLSVVQGDADRDLSDYPDDAFDYAVLSLTIQATRQPKAVLSSSCASAATPSSRSRISATGRCAGGCCSRAACR